MNLESIDDASSIPKDSCDYVKLAKKSKSYMSFSSYYLWFLIDEFDFKITDIKSIITFNKHLRFGNFVQSCMNARQRAICEEAKL